MVAQIGVNSAYVGDFSVVNSYTFGAMMNFFSSRMVHEGLSQNKTYVFVFMAIKGHPVQQFASVICLNSFLYNNGSLWHRGIIIISRINSLLFLK